MKWNGVFGGVGGIYEFGVEVEWECLSGSEVALDPFLVPNLTGLFSVVILSLIFVAEVFF